LLHPTVGANLPKVLLAGFVFEYSAVLAIDCGANSANLVVQELALKDLEKLLLLSWADFAGGELGGLD
jgi:hypothetical protein